MNRLLGVGVLATALLAVGCQKTYDIKFQGSGVPGGSQMVQVAYSGEANIWQDAGVVRQNETLKYKFKVDEDNLPGTLTWRAGGLGGQIQLDKHTASPIYVKVDQAFGNMGNDVPPGAKQNMNQQKEGKTVTETSEPVVVP